MGTAEGMLAEARKSLGTAGRPNLITRDYADRHGDEFLRAPWCDMAVTRWARLSGNADAVLPEGDRAYTPWHADDFRRQGRWSPGTTANTNRAEPGWIVFFDWGGSDSIAAIDHVGVVEKALGGGRVQTIEGNTGDACKRRVRSAGDIAGYGRPAYSGARAAAKGVNPLIGLEKGDEGEAVEALQELIRAAGHGAALGKAGTDGVYGDGTAEGLRLCRKDVGSAAKAGYGDKVTGHAFAQLLVAMARKQARAA